MATEAMVPLCLFYFLNFNLSRLIKMARLHLVVSLAATTKALSTVSQTTRPPSGAKGGRMRTIETELTQSLNEDLRNRFVTASLIFIWWVLGCLDSLWLSISSCFSSFFDQNLCYINGDIFYPPKPIASTEKKADVESEEVSKNEYHLWVQHDKLIVHTIGSSLSENVVPIIDRCATSMEAINKLIAIFSSNTKLRVIALIRSLTMLIQGNKSVAEILQTAKTLADELALAKASIPDDELVIHIFSGINPKLNGYCHYLEIKGNKLTYEDVFDKLVNHEKDLKRQEVLITPLSVNNVQ
ncbi:hypothetical protein V6N13_068366 [Hibiscus sabdariffa]